MGVPKFFRYISERYPCLSELAREHSIPEFDNLYLDMNGIVHNCSHPDDNNIHFHLEEVQIFQDIFNYVDKLFYLIKPQKLFFLAVDGVAPRAKMNQQRSRRFRSAREADQLEAKAAQRGEKREHERFDSNCITPGTEFMVRLQEGLRAFLKTKISTDPLWQRCTVILSGQETPGEGEHKIMDYIRYMKAQPDFDPNTRHCLYGLDADLIILGLCTHELHFVVLREEVKFGKNVKRDSVEETRFFLLHLGLLREYLELEFHELSTAERKFDVAQLIDDWVLMGFMVGNDFIPHLPCLHISSNALPLLYRTYIRIYPTLGGNINENGKLNLRRLQIFMSALTEVELEQFREHADDLKYMNAKTEAFDADVSEITSYDNCNSDLAALIDQSTKLYEGDSDEDWSDENVSLMHEFQNYKRNYYRNKFKCDSESPAQLIEELGHHYVTALQWVLDYYYRGVQSWDWYYPFHYAPFISDLKNIEQVRVSFHQGTPFLPFQQLLAVLPAASCKLLPFAYHNLMLNPASPLAEFFPLEFESDLNGKKHDWEAVVLIPFIDEHQLLTAMRPCEANLTEAERKRNKHGPMYVYKHTNESQGPMACHPPLGPLQHLYCIEMAKWSSEIALNLPRSVCVELPNAARHVFFPGFPTMQHLPFDFELRHDRVKVFEQASRNQNIVLMPRKRQLEDTLEAVAGQYLEQVVHIGWPHLIKAKVVRVATRDRRVDEEGIAPNDARRFDSECKSLQEHFTTRMGIQFANYDVLVYVRTFAGSTVEFGQRGALKERDTWSTSVTGYPAQGVLAELVTGGIRRKQFRKVEKFFSVGSTVFFIGNPYYGSEGVVQDPMLAYSCGRIQVNIRVRPEPNVNAARLLQEERDKDFLNTYEVCHLLNINGRALGRLTGTVWVVLGPRRERMENVAKHNIGLQLKYPILNEERAGYCCRTGNQWFYSRLALELMSDYCQRFPDVVAFFAVSNDRGKYVFEQDVFPDQVGQHRVEALANWVRQQPHMKVERIACGSKTVCRETVELLMSAVDELRSLPVKDVKLQVKPHLLIKPNVTLPEVYRPRRPVRLFDRVVIVRTVYMVPVGIKGTVIGINLVTDPNPVRLECVHAVDTFCEVLFDKPVPNCNDIHGIAQERVYKVPENALVVIFTNEQGQKNQANAQSSQTGQQNRTPVEDVRANSHSRESQQTQQQPKQQATSSRYMTAAGSDWMPITMKTQISDDFVKTRSDDKAKRDRSKPEAVQPQPEKPEKVANWRERTAGPSGPPGPPGPSTKPQSVPENWRKKGGSSSLAPEKAAAPSVAPTASAVGTASPQDQTLALMSLLGLKSKSDSEPSQDQNQNQNPNQSRQQHQQAPGPGQMPILPKPPLFWQQEAQKQQQAQDQAKAQAQNQIQAQPTDRIRTRQWVRRGRMMGERDSPFSQPSPQLQEQILQSHRMMMQQRMPWLAFNDGNQLRSNNNVPAQIVSGNNATAPQYQHYQQPNQQHFHQLQDIGNVAPRYSSIQDFVPIQAYRASKSNRSQTAGRQDSKEANQPSQQPPLAETTESNSSSSFQEKSTNEPKESLNDKPSVSDVAQAVEADEAAATTSRQPIRPRKQRVPRIGAKFDLEYIMH
ncbi:5'-3' exoribonuclease 1 [Drosophila ficusphila]|uniref:5'-3' exoribonuclease 1 n=1 Tax=Drosophila ficusphila TaxID=30025 RepID=UPI0007E63542|nr:5'-3' exoribonuclease 1 [Drosophila ficusphila]